MYVYMRQALRFRTGKTVCVIPYERLRMSVFHFLLSIIISTFLVGLIAVSLFLCQNYYAQIRVNIIIILCYTLMRPYGANANKIKTLTFTIHATEHCE